MIKIKIKYNRNNHLKMLKVYLTNNVLDFDKYACNILDDNPSVI